MDTVAAGSHNDMYIDVEVLFALVGTSALPSDFAGRLDGRTLSLLRDSRGATLLHCASAGTGPDDSITVLLCLGADPNAGDAAGNTPLIEAAIRGYTRRVEMLLEAGADVNKPNLRGETPLSSAVAWGHEETVRVLLRYAADTEQRDIDGATPLLFAVNFGYSNIFHALIAAGANPLLIDNAGNNLAMHAVWSARGELVAEVLRIVGEHGFLTANKAGYTAWQYAQRSGLGLEALGRVRDVAEAQDGVTEVTEGQQGTTDICNDG